MANNCKYYKQQKQYSLDSGQTWSNVTPPVYQVGEFYEEDSSDCQVTPPIIRWQLVPGDYMCVEHDMYEKEIQQYSTDGGISFNNIYPTTFRKGRLIESNSSLCNYKWEGHYGEGDSSQCGSGHRWVSGIGCVVFDPIKIVLCSTSSSSTLTLSETGYSPYKLLYGYIGDCVSSIDYGAFSNMDSLTNIDIPNTVTSIGNWAFNNCSSLSSITIPDSVTTVGTYMFYGCTSLESVQLSSNISGITEWMFIHCHSLSSIDIPDNITSIGASAFTNCFSLTEVTIPSGVTSIGSGVFSGCSSLTSVTIEATTPPTLGGSDAFSGASNYPIYVPCESVLTYRNSTNWNNVASRIQGIPPCVIPLKFESIYTNDRTITVECNSGDTELTTIDTKPYGYAARDMLSAAIGNCVTTIGQQAFNACYNLSSVTIPDSVTIIGQQAFSGCSSLTSVEIPSGVTIISGSVFSNCYRLSSITIPDSVTTMGYGVFNGCTGLTSCTIGSGLTSISNSLFYNCQYLTSVNIPDSVTSIEWDAFRNCYRLANITIPDSVTSINMEAFYQCGITSCTIGSGITSIGYEAFYGCNSLTSVTINATTPPTLGGNAFNMTNNCPIYVPASAVDAFKASWTSYSSRIRAIGT